MISHFLQSLFNSLITNENTIISFNKMFHGSGSCNIHTHLSGLSLPESSGSLGILLNSRYIKLYHSGDPNTLSQKCQAEHRKINFSLCNIASAKLK